MISSVDLPSTPTAAPVLEQLSTLVSFGLIAASGSKYRCAAPAQTVNVLAKSIPDFHIEFWQK